MPSAVCALSCCAPSRPPRDPVHPLTPSLLATPPSPSSACSLQLPCVLLLLLRLSALLHVAACFCAELLRRPLSRPQSRRARSPLPMQAPCRTRDVALLCFWCCRATRSRVRLTLLLPCCCALVALSVLSENFRCALTPTRPRALPAQTVFCTLALALASFARPWLARSLAASPPTAASAWMAPPNAPGTLG